VFGRVGLKVVADRPDAKWTLAEDAQLRDAAVSGETIEATSKRLCRTKKAVYHRATKLGTQFAQQRKIKFGSSRDRTLELELKANQDPGRKLPDDASINQVKLQPAIKRALIAAGLKTVGDIRRTSDPMLLSIKNLGRRSVTRLRNELGPVVIRGFANHLKRDS
jgi:DNA-directed RNA polymerase alpha subunit